MNDEQLYAMRHSLAHITAQAVQHLWPEAKFGVGPVVENGFYYDIDLGETKISEDDFKRIEKEMRKIIAADYAFERNETSVDKALDWARDARQPYKEELLNDLKRSGTTVAKDLDVDELGHRYLVTRRARQLLLATDTKDAVLSPALRLAGTGASSGQEKHVASFACGAPAHMLYS